MIRRQYSDRDGTCFASSVFNECAIMGKFDENCGSYECPFYKPRGCRDWIKIEDKGGVSIFTPEEVSFNGKEKENQ